MAMSNASANLTDYDSISKTVQRYIERAKSGRGAYMKPAVHQDATIFGYIGTDLFANYFNHVAGTEIDLPMVTTEPNVSEYDGETYLFVD